MIRVKVSLDDAINMMPSSRLENYFYKNNGDLTFTKTIEAWGLTFQSYSNGAAYADLNNDGNLDLIINNIEDEASIYKNNAKNNYIQIQLEENSLINQKQQKDFARKNLKSYIKIKIILFIKLMLPKKLKTIIKKYIMTHFLRSAQEQD